MSTNVDLDRTIAAWLGSEVLSPTQAGDVERILATTRDVRPRPGWLAGPGSHWVHEPVAGGRTRLRPSIVLVALVVIVAIAGALIIVGARVVQPPLPISGNGQLAYALDGDIFLADRDGAQPVRIADGAPNGTDLCGSFWAEGPMWSPDGRHLAYRGDRTDCQESVVIADPDGRTVASFPSEGWLVSWSPDSTRVAVWVTLGQTIGIYGVDGQRQAVLDLPAGKAPTGDYDPVWSPDGASLLIRLGPPSPSVVWQIPVDGSAPEKVPQADPRSYPNAAFTRDGSRVAYVPYLDLWSLVMADAHGTELRVLPGARDPGSGSAAQGEFYGDAVWSPTGDTVAYTWTDDPFDDGSGNTPVQTFELRVVDVASGNVTLLATAPQIRPIAFSGDGQRILFERSATAEMSAPSLWSTETNGSEARLIVDGTYTGDWQPSE